MWNLKTILHCTLMSHSITLDASFTTSKPIYRLSKVESKSLIKMLCLSCCWAQAFSQVLAGVGVTGAAWETKALEMERPGVDFTSSGRECSLVSQQFGFRTHNPTVFLAVVTLTQVIHSASAQFPPPPHTLFFPHRHLERIKFELFRLQVTSSLSIFFVFDHVWDTLDFLQIAPQRVFKAKRV